MLKITIQYGSTEDGLSQHTVSLDKWIASCVSDVFFLAEVHHRRRHVRVLVGFQRVTQFISCATYTHTHTHVCWLLPLAAILCGLLTIERAWSRDHSTSPVTAVLPPPGHEHNSTAYIIHVNLC